MYFLHDTHHGTLFSTFSLLSWPEMEINTCQFGAISDSATHSTSCQRFFGIHFGCGYFLISKKKTSMLKLTVTGPPSVPLLSASISTSSSQVLNLKNLWVVSIFENASPRKSTVLSNSPVMTYLYFSNIILLICMISWLQLISPSRYSTFCPADMECSGPIFSRWGNFSSSDSTSF